MNDLAYQPFINSLFSKRNDEQFREHLMNKHTNGEILNEEELRYLDLTSDLTHLFIDKNYYQNMVNIVSKETIMRIESDLIDQILDNYYGIRRFVEKNRNQWLKAKRKVSRKKREELTEFFFKDNINFVRKKLEFKQWLKVNVVKARQRHKALIRNTRKYSGKVNITIRDMKSYIKDKKERQKDDFSFFVKKKCKSRRKRVERFVKRNVPDMLQTELYGRISEKALRRKVFPTSKLLLKDSHYIDKDEDVSYSGFNRGFEGL